MGFGRSTEEPSARTEMETIQAHREQNEQQSPLLEQKAQPLHGCPGTDEPPGAVEASHAAAPRRRSRALLADWIKPKLRKKQAAITIGTLGFLLVVSISYNVFQAAKPQERLPCPSLCPIPWEGYGERCYFFSATEANWTSSQSFCVSHGGSLVTMETPEEKEFVERHRDLDEHWVGLQRESESQPWMRPDGSLFNNSFSIGGGELCAYRNEPLFSSTYCTNTRRWICSKSTH